MTDLQTESTEIITEDKEKPIIEIIYAEDTASDDETEEQSMTLREFGDLHYGDIKTL